MACHDDGHVPTERKCWNNCRSRAFLTSRVAMLNRGMASFNGCVDSAEVASARAAKSLIVCVLYLIRFGLAGPVLLCGIRNGLQSDLALIH